MYDQHLMFRGLARVKGDRGGLECVLVICSYVSSRSSPLPGWSWRVLSHVCVNFLWVLWFPPISQRCAGKLVCLNCPSLSECGHVALTVSDWPCFGKASCTGWILSSALSCRDWLSTSPWTWTGIRGLKNHYLIYEVCPEGIQLRNMKNGDIYWRRYKIQETLYTGQWCLSPLQCRHLGTSHSSPICHQLPQCIFLNLINSLKSLPFQRWF